MARCLGAGLSGEKSCACAGAGARARVEGVARCGGVAAIGPHEESHGDDHRDTAVIRHAVADSRRR